MTAEFQDYRLARVPCAICPYLLETVWNMPVPIDPESVSYKAVRMTVIEPTTGKTYNGELSFAQIAVSALFHNITWHQYYKICKVLLGNGSRKRIRYNTTAGELFTEFDLHIDVVEDLVNLSWSGTDENGQLVKYDNYELRAGTVAQTREYKQILHNVAGQLATEFRTSLELRRTTKKLCEEIQWLETQIQLRTKESQ